MTHCVQVALDAPFHSGIGHLLSYTAEQPLPPGTLVRVPLGSREVLGIVWDEATPDEAADALDAASLRPVAQVLDGQAPLAPEWRRLMEFAARYYQRSLGEVALMALPSALQDQGLAQWHKRLQKIARDPAEPAAKPKSRRRAKAAASEEPPAAVLQPAPQPVPYPELTAQQQAVLDALQQGGGTYLLHGVTGSGKSEVYLRQAEALLRQDPQAQVLFMVPEINLTPQWQQLLQQRFGPWLGPDCVAVLHSGLTPVQRLNHWLAVHQGRARLVLGTRMAVLASFAQLRLIVVDEEHDASYKQQDGARYHARDLAVWRGKQLGVPVVLGSATPSLESWWNSRPASAEAPAGHYRRLSMPERIGQGQLAALRMVDMRQLPRETVLAPSLLQAMEERLVQGEQCMVLLNRRGYAPVLCCGACGWKSDCPHCSAHQVLHKADRSLRCHHCGYASRIPRHCPQCGSTDLAPLGRGTEQLEEMLQQALEAMALPGGRAPLVLRIDADSTRHKGALQQSLAQVHSGTVDVLVGTQMIAKGLDFPDVTLVGMVAADVTLYLPDYRATEKTFQLITQMAGRAGRADKPGLVVVQTYSPQHYSIRSAAKHDYESFFYKEIARRRMDAYAPFARYVRFLFTGVNEQEVAQACAAFDKQLDGVFASSEVAAFLLSRKAAPAPVKRLRGDFRHHVLLKLREGEGLDEVMAILYEKAEGLKNRRVFASMEVNPSNML